MHRQKKNDEYGLFATIVAVVGGAGLVASWWLGSVIPLGIAAIVLVCTLNFMVGLGDKPKHAKAH